MRSFLLIKHVGSTFGKVVGQRATDALIVLLWEHGGFLHAMFTNVSSADSKPTQLPERSCMVAICQFKNGFGQLTWFQLIHLG